MTHASSNSTFRLRPVSVADADACGRICFAAFDGIARKHGFPPDFPAPEAAVGLITLFASHSRFHGIVAEKDGRVVGSNFLDERSSVAGIGPITIDPAVQDAGIGRALMEAILERARTRSFVSVRLVQAAYHSRSFSLYTKLGFDVREPLSVVSSGGDSAEIGGGRSVRVGTQADRDVCNALCTRVHGHDREGEVHDALEAGTLNIAERDGRITGYSTGLGYFGHTVGEAWQDVAAFIAASPAIEGPGLLVPSRESDLLRWLLARGARVIQPFTLMTIGPYTEPRGGWMPSILF
jgi:GNAT superfamily N-acetyltransferase